MRNMTRIGKSEFVSSPMSKMRKFSITRTSFHTADSVCGIVCAEILLNYSQSIRNRIYLCLPLESVCVDRQFRVADSILPRSWLDFGLMHKSVAFIKALNHEVHSVFGCFDGVAWKPFADFFFAADPHKDVELPAKTSATGARMHAGRRLSGKKLKIG